MQQRLAIAQALARRPKVLLLDEPFGALDPGTREQMHELIVPLWREHKMTVVMVTHDLREAMSLGTRLVAIDRARHDPQAPGRFGSSITYDLDLTRDSPVPVLGFAKQKTEPDHNVQGTRAMIPGSICPTIAARRGRWRRRERVRRHHDFDKRKTQGLEGP